MSGKQEKLQKIQELRQRHHALDMEEAKLSILNASQKIVHDEEQKGAGATVEPRPTPSELLKIKKLRGTIASAKGIITQQENYLERTLERDSTERESRLLRKVESVEEKRQRDLDAYQIADPDQKCEIAQMQNQNEKR